jgi:phosphonoacetaldehyde hydrolase
VKLGAVIVDWAGTIVDHGSRAPAAAFVELFRRRDVAITIAEARRPMGLGKKDHIREIARDARVVDAWRAAHGRAPDEGDVEAMYREFIPLQLSTLAAHAAPIPGAIEALAMFRRRGLAIGSTTGYSREMVDLLVAETAPRGLSLDAIVCASDVAAGRPAPWMALRAAERLGVHPMRAIVKIGDTMADVQEGLAAGMWTVAVTRTGNELGLSEKEAANVPTARLAEIGARFRAAGAHEVVESIAHAWMALEKIEARLAKGERP